MVNSSHSVAPAVAVSLPIPWATRAIVAALLGGLGFAFSLWYAAHRAPNILAADFSWGWRAARALLAHQNPYVVIQPTGAYPFDALFKYPLPYALLSLPFAGLAPSLAMAAFEGVGVALFTFGLTRDGWHRLPLLASAPVITTLMQGQTSIWIAAGLLLPSLAWIGACIKPTAALIGLAYRPGWWRHTVVGAAILGGVGLLAVASWPFEFARTLLHDPMTGFYFPALRILPLGPLLLAAAFRWRAPEGRLLLAVAVVPQNQSFYSGVYPLLVAKTYRESMMIALVSNLGLMGWFWLDPSSNAQLDPIHQAPWLAASVYLPALLLVLRRPSHPDNAREA